MDQHYSEESGHLNIDQKYVNLLDIDGFSQMMKDPSYCYKFYKKFAAKCNRPLILQGCEMLGMSIEEVSGICIEGMKEHAAELHLTPETLHE